MTTEKRHCRSSSSPNPIHHSHLESANLHCASASPADPNTRSSPAAKRLCCVIFHWRKYTNRSEQRKQQRVLSSSIGESTQTEVNNENNNAFCRLHWRKYTNRSEQRKQQPCVCVASSSVGEITQTKQKGTTKTKNYVQPAAI